MDLAAVDLNLLKALDALLRERSVTRAAERLSLTQPSMSAALSRLRALFGDEILVRTGRTMRPTPLAESLEAPVRDVLARVEGMLQAGTTFDPRRDERSFTVLATDYPVIVLLRPLLAALRDEAPGVRIRVETALPASFHAGRPLESSDLAIVPQDVARASSLPSQVVFADRFVGAAWAGNDRVPEPLTLEALSAQPYLSFRQAGHASLVDRHLEGLGVTVRPSAVVESFVVGALLLSGTMHVAVLQERLVQRLAAIGELRSLEPAFPLPRITEAMVWHPRLSADPGHVWLRERLVRLGAQL